MLNYRVELLDTGGEIISLNSNGEVEDDLLKDLLDKSYHLVLGGFSKKKQKEILESGNEINGI